MANEINVSATLTAFKASIMSTAISRSLIGQVFSMAGTLYTQDSVSIATSATAIPLGQVTAPHWAFFLNTDPANFLKIRNGSGGADLIKLKAGEFALCPLLDTATPYAIADTSACVLEYLILSL